MSRSYTIVQGDDEEFALSISDPATGTLVDLSTDYNWTVSITFKGKKSALTKAYTNAEIISGGLVNTGHADPNIPDYSIKIVLTAAETAALLPGTYAVSAFVTDSAGLKTTIIQGQPTLIIQKIP